MQFQNVNFADKYSDIIADKKTILSRLMRQEKWFLPHWNYDPTITGMLNMIDAIKTIFTVEESVGYYEKLIKNGQIIFNFLNLDDFQLTDELYIKMNSRGRPLTRFENLKSKLLPLYDEAKKIVPTIYQQKLDQINLDSGKKYITLRDYVSFMFDTKWTDVFWNEWINAPERSEKPYVDDMMLCFISVLAINEHILYKMNGNMSLIRKDPLTKEINDLMSQKDKNAGITIKYDKLIAIFKENNYAFLFKLIDYFNIFNINGTLKTYYDADFEKDLFSRIANAVARSVSCKGDVFLDTFQPVRSCIVSKGYKTNLIFPVSRRVFAGKELCVPCEAERLLESIYGNWKVIPSEEKRIPIHSKGGVIDTKRDYSCYINRER
jgi:hypothetical protein